MAAKRKREALPADHFTQLTHLLRQLQKSDSDELKMKLALTLVDLKKVLRDQYLKVKQAVERTESERQQLDTLHLQLQNRLYERMHLQEEIHACQAFYKRESDVRLAPLDDFLAENPDARGQSPDSHELVLRRLGWELEQRTKIAARVQDLEADKAEIAKDNFVLKSKLDVLPTALAQLKEALVAANSNFDMAAAPAPDALVQRLPRPLYLLHALIAAHNRVHGSEASISLSVVNVDAPTAMAVDGEAVPDWLRVDDLGIEGTLQAAGRTLVLRVVYAPRLDIVLARATITPAIEDLDFLPGLLPDDDGTQLPIDATIRAEGIADLDVTRLTDVYGRPYHWLQALCGQPGTETTRVTLRKFIEATSSRITALAQLAEHTRTLGGRNLPDDSAEGKTLFFPLQGEASIVSWTTASAPTASALQRHVGILSRTFDAGGRTLTLAVQATVTVPLAYPTSRPTVVLAPAAGNTAELLDALRHIEAELNVYGGELLELGPAQLLVSLVRRLQLCLDIFVLTEQHDSHSLYARGIRGRDRVRPYWFNPGTRRLDFRA
eukprot:m.233242 g.233242  ORF g.233242 m.233242 type:complete len:551 (+) comp12482_c0_seq1:3457-5109(+)